jgi:hypothetical protein
LIFNEETLKLRWFLLPSEAFTIINGKIIKHVSEQPFTPRQYKNDECIEKMTQDWLKLQKSMSNVLSYRQENDNKKSIGTLLVI